jgi:UDP-GlcNAc:undecaprenyl-phosphate GlcNAc-1-phosphate transferase
LHEGNGFFGVAAVLMVFILPLADTAVVTINRLRKGQSPFVGGKDHTTHNLSYLGLSDRQVAIIFCAVSILSSGLFLLLINYSNPGNLLVFWGCLVYFLVVFSGLFGITEKNRREGKFSAKTE